MRWGLVIPAAGMALVGLWQVRSAIGDLRDPARAWRRKRLDRASGSAVPLSDWLRSNRRWSLGQILVSGLLFAGGAYYMVDGLRS